MNYKREQQALFLMAFPLAEDRTISYYFVFVFFLFLGLRVIVNFYHLNLAFF